MPYAEKMLSRSLRRAAAASCKLRYCCPNSSQLSVIADADDVLVIPLLPGTPARMYSVGDFITVRRFGLKYGDWDPKVNCCDPGVCGVDTLNVPAGTAGTYGRTMDPMTELR